MRYRAVIFDLDGVLCSTDRYHYLAWKHVADDIGVPFTEEDNDALRGVSRMASLEMILSKSSRAFTPEQKLNLANRKNTLYREYLAGLGPDALLPGVRVTLDALRAAGIPMAVGSSSRNTIYILQRLGLESFFDAVADGTQITHSKPHPEVFLKAAQLLGEAPAGCLVVEDAVSGVEAAHAAGMNCAAVGDAAAHAIPEYRLKSITEVTGIVLGK